MFFGSFSPRLDDKGRLILPAKFRDELEKGLVITKGPNRCLTVLPMAEFISMTAELREAPRGDTRSQERLRVIFASAHDEVPDRQGRITLPGPLREYAGLTRDCTVIGFNERVEIWAADAWAEFLARSEQAFVEGGDQVPDPF
ncbi:MAG: division/cell wall cluster transcriptional repressor MraZ [Actinomycetes bacterium]